MDRTSPATRHGFRLTADGIDRALVAIATMDRDAVCNQLRQYPATFPVDFTEAFLATQSLDRLRHLLSGLIFTCRAPLVENASALAMAA